MASPLRVLFVITDLCGGGAERALLNIVRHLDSARFEPSLFVLRRTGAYWGDVPPSTRVDWGLDGPRRIVNRSWTVLRKIIALARKCDVVVGALELLPSYFAVAAAVAARKPAVAWVHSDMRRQLAIYGNKRAHRVIIRALYPRFRKVVFPSQTAREGFEGVAVLNAAACEIISNPCDIEMIIGRSDDSLPPFADSIFRKPTILGVGTLTNAIKGFDILIQAHSIARSWGCDHNLLVLGDGRDRSALLEMAEQLSVADSTFLPGFQPNPYPFIRAATAIAVPSRFEAFGMVVTEAMTLGTPVMVASSALGALEVVENGVQGLVFPAEDANALATEICEMVENRSARENYSKRGLARAQFFATDQIVRQWEKLLWQVAKPNSGSAVAVPAE